MMPLPVPKTNTERRLKFSEYGEKKRIVSALYPSNNGQVKLKDVIISDDFEDTKIKLLFNEGEVVIDENDYSCTHSENIYFK